MSATTLQERAHRATIIARSVTEEEGQQLLAGETETLASNIVAQVERARSARLGLEEFGIAAGGRELNAARQVVADTAGTYLAEPTIGNLEKARSSLALLRSRTDEYEKAAEKAWHEHRSTNLPPSIDKSYLQQLTTAGFDVGTIDDRVEFGEARLMLLSERRIPQPGDRAAWDHSVTELREAAQALAELAPTEVRSFLSAAVGGGASIEMVTPEVLKFLSERGLDRSFKVVRR
jgi:hypothetical protein